MSISNTYENIVLDWLFSTIKWVGLSTADPTDDGSGLAEPSGNAYARVEVPSSYWGDAADGTISNTTAITFPRATGSWGTVTHVVIWDHASDNDPSHIVASGALDDSLAITSGIQSRFAAGTLDIDLD